jgi:TrmH family RNA methyltransferase
MVVKNQLKLIKSLHQKKYRNESGLFFVEGIKSVNELLASSFKPHLLLATASNLNYFGKGSTVEEISERDLKKVSALKSPNGVLGVFHIPEKIVLAYEDWIVALDSVQDPGNLGTIIRLCDWYGIKHLVCSRATVDCYNPKVLQATMGSISRVNVHYLDLPELLKTSKAPIYGAVMNGSLVYEREFPSSGILLMGNEANGISEDLKKIVSERITIPQFGGQTTESLNVAMATGILLNEIRRKN